MSRMALAERQAMDEMKCRACGTGKGPLTIVWNRIGPDGSRTPKYAVCHQCSKPASDYGGARIMPSRWPGWCSRCEGRWDTGERFAMTADDAGQKIYLCLPCAGSR
jgi:hypothetical protein